MDPLRRPDPLRRADPLAASLRMAQRAIDNQSTRMRVVSENLANAHSTGTRPGEDAYRRKTVSFALVAAEQGSGPRARIGTDRSDLPVRHDPDHPAADADGMVRMPNVSPLVEMADMREASRLFDANVQVVRQTRELINTTIDLLRNR